MIEFTNTHSAASVLQAQGIQVVLNIGLGPTTGACNMYFGGVGEGG